MKCGFPVVWVVLKRQRNSTVGCFFQIYVFFNLEGRRSRMRLIKASHVRSLSCEPG